jgi:hypothetical protein
MFSETLWESLGARVTIAPDFPFDFPARTNQEPNSLSLTGGIKLTPAEGCDSWGQAT